MINKKLLQGYENTELVSYDDLRDLPNTVLYDDLPNLCPAGVLKCNRYVDGKLVQTYTEQESHVACIAATRLGKTTSYVMPLIVSFARQKVKRNMIISDPKGELYRRTAATLKEQGYKVKLLNFRDYNHSECWNMLTPIYRRYRKAVSVADEVKLVETEDGSRYEFCGKIYDSQPELDEAVDRAQSMLLDEVGNDIDNIAQMFVHTQKKDDPYWEDSARDLLKAFLWAMLEDSDAKQNPITEDTFSFNSILSVMATFADRDDAWYDDGGYFTDRGTDSRAYVLAKNTLIENGKPTRKCILAALNTKLAVFRDCAIRLITSCNSFEITELSDGPIAVFVNYRDELKVHYEVISLFIQDAYRYLIECADKEDDGKLRVPTYFVLDEFGNFPPLHDFETTISACAGRGIFFVLIIQSYAQLNSVYGGDVAEIIRDNLNVHIFFGSNNPDTLEAFSAECGKYTRISPLSALNGTDSEITEYMIETIPLLPKSRLSHFKEGECIVTEANCGYVMFSRLERFYRCPELDSLPLSSVKEYVCPVNPFDKKYCYKYKKKTRNLFD